ncbi:hypothetical protein SZMC14600_16471 [Saccharomonospora azurea SZMC 14600]|uniref:ATP-grasp domain-containing protein n=2 Tax=Saccharomonospora azurea TaxID=40988 RepID=UPI0002400839|nr:hypothetical protein [Saccharomonospora azurea]EHK85341.1 hypothetical protein SZMC14600_16471 [Saccharomonospora azurea SZMC 14600]
MTARVLFAGCRRVPEGTGDEDAVVRALTDAGAPTRWAVWDDPTVDFAAAELVVLRATWDYSQRRDEFLAWCDTVPRLRNAARVVRWNTDKRYLLDLAAAGLPIVPTALVEVGAGAHWPDGEFVVKPAVGAGASGARRFGPGDDELAARHLAELHADGRAALVQPYQAHVDEHGETALVFVAGEYSHAFAKAALLAAAPGGPPAGVEELAPAEPSREYRTLAEDTLEASAELLGVAPADLLYARVDVVTGDDGRPVLLELELTEPYLGFTHADPAAPSRFASAVLDQLG